MSDAVKTVPIASLSVCRTNSLVEMLYMTAKKYGAGDSLFLHL